jgi:hypothetical protein
MRRNRHQVCAKGCKVNRDPAYCLSCINMKQEIKVMAVCGHFFHRLQSSHLVISPLKVHQGRCLGDCAEQFRRVYTPKSVDSHLRIGSSLCPFANC